MLILLALLLQARPPEPLAVDAKATLEHIRRNLERDLSPLSSPPPGVPIFRMNVVERHLDFQRPWEDDGLVPSYVHPRAPMYHYDFLHAVTPEAFRSATLHPVGVPLMPAIDAVQRKVGQKIRSYREARARRIVQKELEQLRTDAQQRAGAPR
jgi:hypothetical protein